MIQIYIYVYICVYVYIYMYIYICVYIHIYICICSLIPLTLNGSFRLLNCISRHYGETCSERPTRTRQVAASQPRRVSLFKRSAISECGSFPRRGRKYRSQILQCLLSRPQKVTPNFNMFSPLPGQLRHLPLDGTGPVSQPCQS